MKEYYVDLSEFPSDLRRVVKSWFAWQAIYLRARGSHPGDDRRASVEWETPEQVFWGKQPPRVVSDSEVAFAGDAEISYFIIKEDDAYYIDQKERSSRGRYWMFRRFEDAEKYLLLLIGDFARPGEYSDSILFQWYKQGVDPNVSLKEIDPDNYPGRVSLTVDQEDTDRGWMSEYDATIFSHAIALTYEELDGALRQGIPPDWFGFRIVDESSK
jgi:hypothetical protein